MLQKVDYWSEVRSSSYFNALLVHNPLELLKKYSIHPPDNAKGKNAQGRLIREIKYVRRKGPIKVSGMFGKKVAYMDLVQERRGRAGLNKNSEGAGTLYATCDYAISPERVPVYWLPWDSSGAIVRLRIPRKGSYAPDPDLFFTAAINGCSVFFQGDQYRPTVYHAGGDTGYNHPAQGAKFWHDLTNTLTGDNIGAEINKTDYIKSPNVQVNKGGKQAYSTQAAKDYQDWLNSEYSKKLEIETVDPWGCVMGIRDEQGRWTFYLQENASVTYHVLRKTSFWRKTVRARETIQRRVKGKMKDVKIDKKRTVSRPIRVREIFPTSRQGGAFIAQPMPRKIHG